MDTGIGATLREAREDQGRSIEDVALALRARVTQLHDLEDERFEAFGGDVYAKGFLKSYALELGLDPAPLLETYRREITKDEADPHALVSGMATPTKPRRSAPSGWVVAAVVAVLVIAVVGLIGMLGPSTTPEVADSDDLLDPPPTADDDEADGDGDAVGEDTGDDPDPGTDDEPDPDVEVEADASDDPDAESDAADPDGVELLLEFEDRSWMRVEVDGTLVLEEIVEAGEILPFEGDDEIIVRFGNAGGVRAQLNGEDLGAQGGRGDVVSVVFTPEGAEVA